MRIIFLQPFGIGFQGGGARILRGLLQNAPFTWTSVNSSSESLPTAPFGKEIHIPFRPSFGRLERTRLNSFFQWFDKLFSASFRRRLIVFCKEFKATGIHSIPHGLDFIEGWQVSKKLGCKFFLNIHDDLEFSIQHHPLKRKAINIFPEIWREADARIVISEQMGKEYCLRYGEKKFEIITDGLKKIASARPRLNKRLNIYFMGLFHISYEPNLSSLIWALNIISSSYPELDIKVTMRGVQFRREFNDAAQVCLLPFGSEADVVADLQEADILYLPLPFEERYKNFISYSLSTKMVTYLGSGLPIFYHGPMKSATCKMLKDHGAALVCDSCEPDRIAVALKKFIVCPKKANSIVARAEVLANKRFMLADQQRRFWRTINSM